MDWNTWVKENSVKTETAWINTIHYLFATLRDGWIAIYEIGYDGRLYPQIQAADMGHAETWCSMREPVTVPLNVIC